MSKGPSSSVSDDVTESLRLIEDLKFFLVTAPANWQENQVIRRYYLNNDEGFVSCVFWNNLYFITGTDIVRCILYKFQQFGRTITDRKKFEEGIFSDLRNLKAGTDAVLEEPKSEFLDFLFKNSCLRTQKKQKVFYWFNVPHDKLMADALDRDLKREKLGQTPTSVASKEPALSFNYEEDTSASLYEQLTAHLDMTSQSIDVPVKGDPAESPEYVCHSRVPGYEDEVADENEDDDEEDDDFPLDYIQEPHTAPGEYITLDGAYHSGAYINALDNDFDSIDASFIQRQPVATNIASTDDYLIEQTQPARSLQSEPKSMFPRSANEETSFMSSSPAQIHAQYPTNIPSAAVSQYSAQTMVPYPIPTSAVMSQFYDPGYGMMHEQMPSFYQEEMYGHPMTQMGSIGPVVYEEMSPYRGAFYGGHDLSLYNTQPSLRQREVSFNMMRKRQQLQPNKVTKPRSRKPSTEYENRIYARAKRDSSSSDSTETLMPTPESSANVQTDDTLHPPRPESAGRV
ncbi:uncharacterized protein CXQ87_000890 [Candidozyma duobushaemuli]|uniref:Uncharacterized protein n=2 Tax=Candidozyma TaxID=3303203 RepID=A0ABX8I2A2_9ASCO|nr:uncharacterized protein CXQ87_000890 [[Candida] duobushaemulonis]PVH17980.1 hypothetical protein CXQ87_000890 [[Candida] duobushaemulonis]QWU86559.1 hypothetical protein CA3LBN_000777 [[Candida] haemuloni]